MKRESSRTIVTSTPGGSVRSILASAPRTPSMTATVFSPIARRMSIITAGASPSHTALVGRSDVSSARPMSAMRMGVPSLVATTMLLKSVRRVHAAEGAQQQLALALLDGAAGNLDVLRDDGLAHLVHRQAVRVELLDVDDDVNFAGASARQAHFADAVDRLDAAGDLLVGQLGQRSQAHRLGRDDERHDRIGVGIDLRDDGRKQRRRNGPEGAGHFFANVVDRLVQIALEDEAHDDARLALGDARLNLVDARHAADRLFHRLDDRRRHLVGAGARQRQGDADRRRIGPREQVHAQPLERERAEHHERHHQHRRRDGPADAEFRQHENLPNWSRRRARRRSTSRRQTRRRARRV